MAVKIFKSGNYIEVIDGTNRVVQTGSANVEIRENVTTANVYDVLVKDVLVGSYPFASIQDENGNAYASVSAFETWVKANSSFSPATAVSVDVVATNLATHEANTSNPHSVTKLQVGLSNVDNTSDANKPVSTAQQTALNLKADLSSPALTGNPTAPTQNELDNSTKLATTEYVDKLSHRALKKSSFSVRASNGTRVSMGTTTSGFGTLSNNTDTVSGLTNYATSSTAGSYAGLEATALTEFPINANPNFQAVIKTSSDITNQRLWAGLLSVTLLDTDNQSGINIAFRYSTVAGDTGWRGIVDDGTTQVVSDNIGTVAVDTYYYLNIRCDYANNKYYFSVNGSAEVEVNANSTIATGTKLGWCVEMTNPATGVRSFNFSRLDCEHN